MKKTAASSQGPGCVTSNGESRIAAPPSSSRGQRTPGRSNEGRGLLRAWKPEPCGWLRGRTRQSGCAWWRHHVTRLPISSPPRFPGKTGIPVMVPPRPSRPPPLACRSRAGGSSREPQGFRRSPLRRGGGAGRRASCSRSARNFFPSRSSVPTSRQGCLGNPSQPLPPLQPRRRAAASLDHLDHCRRLSLGFLQEQRGTRGSQSILPH